MYEDVVVHARTETGAVLCGKKEFAAHEVLQGDAWDGVTCPECNKERLLIKTSEDVDYANRVLRASEEASPPQPHCGSAA